MNRFVIMLCGAVLLAACNTRPSSDATTTDSSTAAVDSGTLPSESVAPATLSARLTGIGLTPDHDWRQVSIGDEFTAAKAGETTAPFEQDATHVGYSQEFDNLESIDYQYVQQAGRVSRIEVDLYLNNAASAKAWQQELTTYLNARYGLTPSGTSWKSGAVTLKDVSKGKDYGLKLLIR